MANLHIRKLADSDAERVKLYDPITGDASLYLPEEVEELVSAVQALFAGVTPTPRPFLGIKVEGKAPKKTKLPTGFVSKGISEGWIEPDGEGELVVRSAGPAENPFGTPPHTFLHYKTLTLRTVDGDVVYKVVENPDKWPDEKKGKAGFGGEVRHFYEVELA